MSELKRCYEGIVAKNEIDQLGHMNTRYYAVKAGLAAQTLASSFGLGKDWLKENNASLYARDAYTRFYKEQFEGTPIAIDGGVLSIGPDSLRVYHELLNTETGDVAAAFVQTFVIANLATRTALPIPANVEKDAASMRISWPERGQPRTLDLSQTFDHLSLAAAERSGRAWGPELVITEDQCDAHGFLALDHTQEIFGLTHARSSGDDPLDWTMTIAGRRLGWAMLESRAVLRAPIRGRDRIRAFTVDVALQRKTRLSTTACFNLNTGACVAFNNTCVIALDLKTRRSTEIPDEVRAEYERTGTPTTTAA